ncbi:efflux RND transporter periplasmic adaptor subunit [Pseudaestuariivita rosea]|uniref:efflux RND transporter periplasmic adaptor subunit n=1 Tax=Pseudaestuariivita rosea TaxID=2763263 RepID=UPI001F006DB2|nr:efflux RND transporter periplasmic adaptor subunit [Pseudaestuariivita rosea]
MQLSLSNMSRIAVITLAAVSLNATPALAQGGPSVVGVETVEVRELSETVPVFGEIVASRESDVAAQVSGLIATVDVLTGDNIQQGQLLAQLDTDLLQIELDQAQAALAEAQAGIAVARARVQRRSSDFSRIDSLRGTSAFSEGRFDEATGDLAEARGQLAEAEARLLNAQASLAQARYNLDRASITAPFSGVVLSVSADPGQFIQVGASVARLLDVGALEVEANVPSRYIAALTPDLIVLAQTEDGYEVDLSVRAILPTEFAATRTRPVRFNAIFPENGRPVAVGQSITVSIPVDTPREVLSVPKDALVQGRGGWTVFVNDNGTAQPRSVTVGVAMGDRFELLSGLDEGDQVVVRGNERLRPGQPIQPADMAAAQNSSAN